MSLKERVWPIIILLLCIMVVSIFLLIQQINILLQIVATYVIICLLPWGIFLITRGVKQLRQARQEGKRLRWNQNPYIILGMFMAVQPILGLGGRLWGKDQIGHTGWLIVDLIEFIVVSVLLVILLFLEVVVTVGIVRAFLNGVDPFPRALQDVSSEEQSTEKHHPEEDV